MTEDTDLQAFVTILQHAIESHEPSEPLIGISPAVAEGILTILRALPKSRPKGRPMEWSYFDEQHALEALLADCEVIGLAREMARRTGQKQRSAHRRLQEMKSDLLKKPKPIKKKATTGHATRRGRKNT